MSEKSVGDTTAPVSDDAEKKTAEVETVPKAELAKVLNELHKFKTQVKELTAKQEIDGATRLKEKEDFKTLSETYEKKWNEEVEGHAKTKSSIEHDRKFNAALAVLRKEGLIEDAEKLLDKDSLDDLVVEHTDQGRYIVHGKELLVQRFKKDYSFAFKNEKAPKINSGGGKVPELPTVENITTKDVFAAEEKYKAGKITQADYRKVVHLFQNRKKA